MAHQSDQPADRLGLAGLGSCRRWELALDRDEWSLEMEGPHVYLVFQLPDVHVIAAALEFLRSPPRPGGTAMGLGLGRFGSASVSLEWDNEESRRCFLIVGPRARSTLRLTLDADDIRMLAEALQQLVQQLPQEAAPGANGPA